MAIPFAGFASNLGPRARKLMRYAGFTLLALVTFVFAFQMVFPFQRVKDRIIDALSAKYDVTIGSVERGFMPGRMYVKALTLRTRPAKASDVASTLYVEQLEIDLGILALLRGAVAVNVDAKIGPGHIKGTIEASKSNLSVDLAGNDLPSGSLPMRELLGLPMSGKLQFNVDLDVPNEKAKTGGANGANGKVGPNWAKLVGSIELVCPASCVIGDGKTKLKPKLKNTRNQAIAEDGIEFGKVNIDSLSAKVDIKNGKLGISRFDAKSGDGELRVDLDVALNQDLESSLVTGCLRFRGSDALAKREPKTYSAISLTGASLGPDNLFHIKLDGSIRDLRKLGQICGPSVNTNMDNPGGPARPNLTVPEPSHVPPIPPPTAIQPPPSLPAVTNTPPPAVPEAPTPPPNSPQGEAVAPGQPIPGLGQPIPGQPIPGQPSPAPTGSAEAPSGSAARP